MRAILFLFLSLVAVVSRAGNPRADNVQLSSRDRGEISRIACTSFSFPEAHRIEASRERKGASLIRVMVRCGSHRNEGAVPVAHLAKCANAGAKWS